MAQEQIELEFRQDTAFKLWLCNKMQQMAHAEPADTNAQLQNDNHENMEARKAQLNF